ncbi:hypothetical protein Tco_1062368 [Tanacetum coccineum]
MCARYGVWTTSDTTYPKKISLAVLIEAPWFLIAALVEARISLIMLEFSSCLLADYAINLVSDSFRLGLQSGYEEFPLFCWENPGPAALYCPPVMKIIELGFDSSKPVRSFSTSGP